MNSIYIYLFIYVFQGSVCLHKADVGICSFFIALMLKFICYTAFVSYLICQLQNAIYANR